jgi:outer membrane protein assembly factor BamB
LGNVYVMTADNQIFALQTTDGAVQWQESGATELTGVFGVSAPSIGQGTIVAGFSSGELNAYRYENGRVLWGDALTRTSTTTSVSALADIDASPVIDRGRVFAVGKGGRMVSLELVTGQRLWEINLAGISTPWVAGEWVFVVTDDARLLCEEERSAQLGWAYSCRRPFDFGQLARAVGQCLGGGWQGAIANQGRRARFIVAHCGRQYALCPRY